MVKPAPPPQVEDPRERALARAMDGFFDPEWYQARYSDVIGADLDPLVHFVRHGLLERRDPNRFFDCAWYSEHYPDVSVSGLHPLLHYLQTGAAELRNPHPAFDAAYYVQQHPDAASNPLLFHIRTGLALGYLTEPKIDIDDYLPSSDTVLLPPNRVVVDVVIPVYRGLAETQRCIASVLANTGRPLGQIIVVDDRSPDPQLSAWLQTLADQRRIRLLRNQANQGFVTSVNRGIEAAGSHDVVLLNSDTEVPPDWLSRLAAQAYAQPRIATVSPFSNNATICSYPSNEGGPIAFGLKVEEIDEVCRTVNAGRAIDVPTTVGFCMYIRRKALREVGIFDAERFTIGYGEENDFCLRATGLGWRHRLACDTFVYHKGSVSFGDRTKRLSERAMQLIVERFPDYPRDIAQHVSLGEVAPFRFAVTAALFRQSTLPVILTVAHDLGGGVRRHIESLIQRFQQRARFLLLAATDRGATLLVPSLPGHPALSLPAGRVGDLALLLRSMNVSRVHVHHLLGMDMDIRALIHRLGVPFDVTVHDYYAICPQINLLPWPHGLYCGEPDIGACNACIAQRSSHGARDIVTWRAEWAWQFKQAARVFCPSLDVLARLRRFGLDANAVLAPHEAVEPGPWPQRVLSPGEGKLRIAVLGTLVDHKGGRTVASVAEIADRKTTEFHLIGHTDGPFPERALRRMKITGRYEDADLGRLIETVAPHLIWFPAAWPETFSYTLSAAIAAGIPVAATRIGAHTERLDGRPFTWLADPGTSPIGWIRIFDEIRSALTARRPPAPLSAQTAPMLDDPEPRPRRLPRPTGAARGADIPTRPAAADYYATNYLPSVSLSRPPRSRVGKSGSRIVIVPERFDIGFPTPCAYIRLLQPLYHPAISARFDVQVATAETIFEYQAECIVTQRFAMPDAATVDRLAGHARDIGATLAFDLDDDLLNIPRSHPDARLLRPHAKAVRRMLDVADTVWVSTASLAERLSAIRPDVMVVENGLDERIWTAPVTRLQDQPVRLLCMGTTTHDRDFALIEPVLARLKNEYGHRIVIDVVGMTHRNDLPAGLTRISPPIRAMRSYPGFVNWLSSAEPPWHIGLAPLLDTPFNRCKSPIKAMDYAAMGLLVLASDTPVYRGSIADGPAGQLVANTQGAWYAALSWFLRNRDARQTIAVRSRDAFLANASLAKQADVRRNAWSRLLSPRKNHAAA